MLDVTYRRDGVGLSTPQLGKGKGYVFVNPMIVKFGKEREADTLEGCLPFYGAQADRLISIRVESSRHQREEIWYRLQGLDCSNFPTWRWPWYLFAQGVLYIDQMTPKALNSIGQELLNLEEEFEKRCLVRLRVPFSTYRKLQLTKNNKRKSESNRAELTILCPTNYHLKAIWPTFISSWCFNSSKILEQRCGRKKGRPSCDSGIQTQQQRWQRKFRKTSVRNREKQLDDGQDVEIGVEG
ncbi:hypothetical protein SELMODRAFT_412157 [Selaginella moellendorffii]|uniref:Peptide deformylase n=1 Tax=Selaginella moellendorffii TaxID=88036 RepID=D8RK87_SELML|nr:hypothetical protein SELMODRAFT_412157 [Selaginella moellendorffii]